MVLYPNKLPESERVCSGICRYAWADNPVDANLYNSEGLPVTPFQVFVK